jgi:hypothetical protein
MFPSPLPWTDANKHESLNSLSHHPVVEMTKIGMEKQKCMPSCYVKWINGLGAKRSLLTPTDLPSTQHTAPAKLPMPRSLSSRKVYSAKGSTPLPRQRTRPQPALCISVKPQARKQPLLGTMGNQTKNAFNSHLRRAPIERPHRKAQKKQPGFKVTPPILRFFPKPLLLFPAFLSCFR